MPIAEVEALALKIDRGPERYQGFAAVAGGESGYYRTRDYRCVYSPYVETVLVKITDDEGLVGWGEALSPAAPEATAAIVNRLLRPLLLGADPLAVDVLWSSLYDSMRERGHTTGFMLDAISGVDIALWDLRGQRLNQPVAALLGGAYRERVPCYVSGLPEPTEAERLAAARDWLARGFTAFKLHLGHGIAEDSATAAAVREAVGAEAWLAFDAHWRYSVPEAIALGRRLEALDYAFLEAPTLPEDIAGHAEIARALDLAVATGEAERTRYQFRDRLVAGAVEIVQPDIGRTGLTEGRKIADLAETFNVPVAPHLSLAQGPCIAASIHYAAALPNLLRLEYQPAMFALANRYLARPLVCEAGSYRLPAGPGLGLELDEAALRRHAV